MHKKQKAFRMLGTLRVFTLTLITVIEMSAACRCPYKTDKEKFCTAESVSLVYVKDGGTVFGSSRRYRVELLHQYKTYNLLGPALDSEYVYTPVVRSTCGVRLQKGAMYAISGRYLLSASFLFRFFNSRMTTTLCDLQKRFNPKDPYVPPKC